jgi:hypothetical protein
MKAVAKIRTFKPALRQPSARPKPDLNQFR